MVSKRNELREGRGSKVGKSKVESHGMALLCTVLRRMRKDSKIEKKEKKKESNV